MLPDFSPILRQFSDNFPNFSLISRILMKFCKLQLCRLLLSALPVVLLWPCSARAAAPGAPTVTSLTIINPKDGSHITNVNTLTPVTLSAKVVISGTATPVYPGQVEFCDATSCSDIHHLATVQLQPGGIATYTLVPGPGSHSYRADLISNTTYAGSTSDASSLQVSGQVLPFAVFTAPGPRGTYTLTNTIYGRASSAPTGTVNFVDDGYTGTGGALIGENSSLAQATLVPNPAGFYLGPSPAFAGIEAVAIADFNNDGIPDTLQIFPYGQYAQGATCNSTPGQNYDVAEINVITQLSDSSSQLWVAHVGCDTTSVATGDFNNDGKIDLIAGTSASGPAAGALTLALNNGSATATQPGTFTTSSTITTQTGIYGSVVATADLNIDGNEDILAIVSGHLYAGLGDGNGSFTAKTTSIPADSYYSVVTGDFNGDGIPDVVFPDFTQGKVLLFTGAGDGTFTASSSSPSIANPISIATADFNGDGNLDLVVSSSTANPIILLGDGADGFTPWAAFSLPPSSSPYTGPVAVADFNGDGIADLVVGQSVLLGNGSGAFTLGATSTFQLAGTEPNTNSIVTADLNLDGLPDIFAPGGMEYASTQSSTATAASVNITPPGTGTHPIIAFYPGDNNYGSNFNEAFQYLATAMAPAPTVTLYILTTPAIAGQPVTFEVFVKGTGQDPTGTVTFLDGTSSLGSANLSGGGAFFTTSSLSAGTHSITASYPGDTNYPSATSAAQTLTVTALPTPAISLTASTISTTYGSPVTLTSTLTSTSGVPTGTVIFYTGTTSLGTGVINGNGIATFTTPPAALPPGSDAVTAAYSGSSQFSAVTSTATTVTVSKATPGFTVNVSPSSAPYDTYMTFTAILSYPGADPTGSIKLIDGTTILVQHDPDKGVLAIAEVLAVGSHSISASYLGDENYNAVTATPVTATITGLTPTVTLTLNPQSALTTQTVTMTATVTSTHGILPGGSVTFFDGAAFLASQQGLGGNGEALFSSQFTAGTHSITASYAGDLHYSSATSTPAVLTVSYPLTITPANTTSYVGSSNTVTISLQPNPGSPAPTGTVTLSGSGYTSSATPFVNGSASIIIPANALPVGNDSLTVSYSGDSVYPPTSNTFQITVTSTPPSFTLAGKTTSLTLAPGATTGNTVPITITPSEGFTGSVTLTAAITGPAGAIDTPTLSFGTTSPVSLDGKSTATATLTISTTASSTTSAANHTGRDLPWYAGGTVLAGLLFFGIPARKRGWRTMLGLLLSLGLGASILTACGGSSSSSSGSGPKTTPGTTPGAYQIQVTATSGSTTSKTSIALTIQ